MNKYKKNILEKIRKKKAKIGVLGLGYVGLPLSLSFVNSNFKVFGFDTDRKKINKIKRKKSFIWSISNLMIKKALSKGFEPTTSFSKIRFLDVIIICVPTPLNLHDQPDLSYLVNSIKTLMPNLKKGQLISIESTTYPGTTEEELIPRLKRKGFKIGEDFFVCYSPEREDPGNKSFSTKSIPKIVGGFSKNCLDIAILLYSYAIKKVIPVSSLKIAEMTKLHENIYRLINIGLVNEMKMICDKMKIDIHEVIEAAKTKPFGFTPYYPGPGIGGHCIPIDPNYLTWKAKKFSVETKFITLAQNINNNLTNWILDKLLKELNLRNKVLKNLKILFVGIAYKKNVDDHRESPSIKLIKLLNQNKAIIDYHDPYIKKFKFNFLENKMKKSISLSEKNISKYDLIIIGTDHDNIDYKKIFENSELILDTRGKYLRFDKKIIKA